MKFYKIGTCLCLLLFFTASLAYAAMAVPTTGTKKLDLTKYHNVGNIWLRVSNYGFFGSGDDIVPQYPSLEYPGGSGIDYLYQGALWFGAKKQRRDTFKNKLYWLVYPPSETNDTIITQADPRWNPTKHAVIDTLVSVGFDGDWDLYEFLPAYNPLLVNNPDETENYSAYNNLDGIIYATTRKQKRAVDDDGDGKIDEDGAGFTFPYRTAAELPAQFSENFGGQFLADVPISNFTILDDPINAEIWFPLGFMDLSYQNSNYAFAAPYDDDSDGRIDEDGAPVSEQDYISFYYDYCPFGTSGDRDYGTSSGVNTHYPLSVRIRQMSYQWSYEYIKNLVYVEFDITNMNEQDTLYDCAMGIYMDCDVGPQTWGVDKAADDKSGYVKGTGYEFAYTYDADFDNGITPGLVGARVCTPDPEKLKFHCWYWKVGDGPDDGNPYNLPKPGETSNEKYWLLTGRNPKPSASTYTALRPEQEDLTEWEQPTPNDTRFLFSFYGAQPNNESEYNDPEKRWNLPPKKTMKIVVAVFPGDNKEDLKRTARWAKEIYGQAQDLITVTQPDTFPHYNPPEPPDIPNLYAELQDNGNRLDVYWDNRSEFSYDVKTVSTAIIGWQNPESSLIISGLDSDPRPHIANNWVDIPEEYRPGPPPPPGEVDTRWNMNALVNPYTASRLRRDFQGYTLWGRSGSGSQEDWEMIKRWDKVDTPRDHSDYTVNSNFDTLFVDFGGYLGIDTDLPNKNEWNVDVSEYHQFYCFDENYLLVPNGDTFYGWPIYEPNPVINGTPHNEVTDWQFIQDYANSIIGPTLETTKLLQARIFKHKDISDHIFYALYDPKLIPLQGFAFPGGVGAEAPDTLDLIKLQKERLARRYYRSSIMYPRKGVEYYVALTAYDRGIPSNDLDYLESGRDSDANMKVLFPGPLAKENMDNIMVIPNPYIGRSSFDGRRENDEKGDKSRRIWFINLPKRCDIRIYTLAGDLVQTLKHDGAPVTDIITISKASTTGLAADGMESWDLLSKNRQIIAPGVYLFSVENKADSKIKVGKFVIIK